jgi:hypothetical protein
MYWEVGLVSHKSRRESSEMFSLLKGLVEENNTETSNDGIDQCIKDQSDSTIFPYQNFNNDIVFVSVRVCWSACLCVSLDHFLVLGHLKIYDTIQTLPSS